MDQSPHDERTEIARLVSKLSDDVHAVKGSLAANTSFTREVLERLETMHERQTKTDDKLGAIAASNVEMLEVFNAGKRGVNFFQWLGRMLFRLARWAGPIIAVGAAVWAILHGQPPSPKGHE